MPVAAGGMLPVRSQPAPKDDFGLRLNRLATTRDDSNRAARTSFTLAHGRAWPGRFDPMSFVLGVRYVLQGLRAGPLPSFNHNERCRVREWKSGLALRARAWRRPRMPDMAKVIRGLAGDRADGAIDPSQAANHSSRVAERDLSKERRNDPQPPCANTPNVCIKPPHPIRSAALGSKQAPRPRAVTP
jgi:hypothetical protein